MIPVPAEPHFVSREKDISDDDENKSMESVEIPPENDLPDNTGSNAIVPDAFEQNIKDQDTEQNDIEVDERLSCECCDYEVQTKIHLNNHVQIVDKECLSPCLHCGNRGATYCSLCNHVKFIHDSEQLDCVTCENKHENFRHIKKHMTTDHSNLASSSQECDLTISTNPTLESHIRWVHKEQILDCQQCEYKGKTKENINHHKRKIHASSGIYNNVLQDCGICGKWFFKETNMCIHITTLHRKHGRLKVHNVSPHPGSVRFPVQYS